MSAITRKDRNPKMFKNISGTTKNIELLIFKGNPKWNDKSLRKIIIMPSLFPGMRRTGLFIPTPLAVTVSGNYMKLLKCKVFFWLGFGSETSMWLSSVQQ